MPRLDRAGPDTGADQDRWLRARTTCLQEARRVLRDPSDAEEAAQEAVLRAWRQPDHAIVDHAGWLRAVARNEALRLADKRRLRMGRESPQDAGEVVDQSNWEMATLDAVLVADLLSSLGERDRELLVLRYLEDQTQPQIAARLGMPEGTVKVRLHRLRRRLQEHSQDRDH